jgi:hypothetical protein
MKKVSIAAAALIAGILSFLQLFGIEKALFAIFLGWAAIEQTGPSETKGKKLAYAGIILGSVYIFVLLGIAIAKGPELMKLIGAR